VLQFVDRGINPFFRFDYAKLGSGQSMPGDDLLMIYDNRTFRYTKGPVSGQFSRSSPCSIVPRVTLSSFGRSKFTWCLQEAWGDGDLESYLELSQNHGWNPFKRVGYSNERMRNLLQPVGKWLLKDDLGATLAMAEVQVTNTGFSRIMVALSLSEQANSWDRTREAFSYLVSALFIITSCDLLECIVEGGEISDLIDPPKSSPLEPDLQIEKGVGRNRSILAPRIETFVCDNDWSLSLKSMNVWEVGQLDWWTFDSAKKDIEDLKYLQKRKENDQQRKAFAKTLKRRRSFGLLSRLFGKG